MRILSPATVEALRRRARSEAPSDERFAPEGFHEPLSAGRLRFARERLGFALPESVRQLYGEVANGGFGPGYGLIGLVGGQLSDLKTDVVEDYLTRRAPDPDDPGWSWPEGVLAVCHWGCAIYSCVDCTSADVPILRFDPNHVDEDWSVAWGAERASLAEWLEAWLDGEELFESGAPPSA